MAAKTKRTGKSFGKARPEPKAAAAAPEAQEPKRVDWTATFRDVGPIREATVTVKPITLFVGENNSGKTWLASLIWGHHRWDWSNSFLRTDHADWLEARHDLGRIVPDVEAGPDNAPETTAGEFGDEWRARAQAIAPLAFRDLIAFVEPCAGPNATARYPESRGSAQWRATRRADGGGELRLDFPSDRISQRFFFHRGAPAAINETTASIATSVLLCRLSGAMAPLPAVLGEGGFVPASRSSFMKLLPTIAQEVFDRAARREVPPGGAALRPTHSWFASRLLRRSEAPARHADLAHMLERELLGGRVVADPSAPAEFRFDLGPQTAQLPMIAASSVVGEVAPLVHLLRDPTLPAFLVIEEPEAHLHPRVQRILARVLVRLANRGVKLLISTHSDLFAQQINNCMKLGAAKKKLQPGAFAELVKKLDMHEEEALAVDDVAAYGFTRQEDGSTKVEELVKTSAGVAMPTFNEELDALNREIGILYDALGDDA